MSVRARSSDRAHPCPTIHRSWGKGAPYSAHPYPNGDTPTMHPKNLTIVGHTTLRNCGPGPHYVPSWEWGMAEIGCVDPVYTEAWKRSQAIAEIDDAEEAEALARGAA